MFGIASASAPSRSHGSSLRKRSATSYVAPPHASLESRPGSIRARNGATCSMSRVRTRVANSDWCASRNVVSVTARVFCSRSTCAQRSGPSLVSNCFDPAGTGRFRMSADGSFTRGWIIVAFSSPFGLLTLTSARYCSSLVPRSAGMRWTSSSGRSSMKDVVTWPARKSGSVMTASRNGMFVDTPRIRNSVSAR